MDVVKVSSRSNPNAVAGAIAGVVRERGAAEIQVIGAGAVNQAIKAIAIARGFVVDSGVDLVCFPTFTGIDIDGQARTGILLRVEDRLGRTVDLREAGGRQGAWGPDPGRQAHPAGSGSPPGQALGAALPTFRRGGDAPEA